MAQVTFPPDVLLGAAGKTAIITGGARGIGAATALTLNRHGANVVIVDLAALQNDAETLMASLEHPEKAKFVPASVTEWASLVHVFKETLRAFGRVDIVIANAGIMETSPVLDFAVDDAGDPVESGDFDKVVDVNLKGVFNSTSSSRPRGFKTLTPSSPQTRPALHGQEHARQQRLQGLRGARLVHLRLFRRHGKRRLCGLETRRRRPPQGIRAKSGVARHQAQHGDARLHPDPHHGWVR